MGTEVARLVTVNLQNRKGLETSFQMAHQVRFVVVGNWQYLVLGSRLCMIVIYFLVAVVDYFAIRDFFLVTVILVRVFVLHLSLQS